MQQQKTPSQLINKPFLSFRDPSIKFVCTKYPTVSKIEDIVNIPIVAQGQERSIPSEQVVSEFRYFKDKIIFYLENEACLRTKEKSELIKIVKDLVVSDDKEMMYSNIDTFIKYLFIFYLKNIYTSSDELKRIIEIIYREGCLYIRRHFNRVYDIRHLKSVGCSYPNCVNTQGSYRLENNDGRILQQFFFIGKRYEETTYGSEIRFCGEHKDYFKTRLDLNFQKLSKSNNIKHCTSQEKISAIFQELFYLYQTFISYHPALKIIEDVLKNQPTKIKALRDILNKICHPAMSKNCLGNIRHFYSIACDIMNKEDEFKPLPITLPGELPVLVSEDNPCIFPPPDRQKMRILYTTTPVFDNILYKDSKRLQTISGPNSRAFKSMPQQSESRTQQIIGRKSMPKQRISKSQQIIGQKSMPKQTGSNLDLLMSALQNLRPQRTSMQIGRPQQATSRLDILASALQNSRQQNSPTDTDRQYRFLMKDNKKFILPDMGNLAQISFHADPNFIEFIDELKKDNPHKHKLSDKHIAHIFNWIHQSSLSHRIIIARKAVLSELWDKSNIFHPFGIQKEDEYFVRLSSSVPGALVIHDVSGNNHLYAIISPTRLLGLSDDCDEITIDSLYDRVARKRSPDDSYHQSSGKRRKTD